MKIKTKWLVFLILIGVVCFSFINFKQYEISTNSIIYQANSAEGQECGDIEFSNFCNEPGVSKTLKFIGYMIFATKVVVPLILILMVSIDFLKNLTSNEEDPLKTSFSSFIRRLIIGICIYLLPTMLTVSLGLIDNFRDIEINYNGCFSCALNPHTCIVLPEKKCDKVIHIIDDIYFDKPNEEKVTGNQTTVGNAIADFALYFLDGKYEIKPSEFKYIKPAYHSQRINTYNKIKSSGKYQSDCNTLVGFLVHYGLDKQVGPEKGTAITNTTIAGPSGNSWAVRSYYNDTFEVVAKNLSLSSALDKLKPGDLLASNGDGSTHIQIYVGEGCVIGYSGGITKKCTNSIPHKSGKFTIIRIKEEAAAKIKV